MTQWGMLTGDMGHLVLVADDTYQLPSSADHEQAAHSLPR